MSRPVFFEGCQLGEFEKKIEDFLVSANLPADKNILLAVSGGADSVALMFAIHRLKKRAILTSTLLQDTLTITCAVNNQMQTRNLLNNWAKNWESE